ncbi:MAG TPA: M20/M25/M40 family metallo-hydrolase [Pirellulales bacterium]|nr:M20/M25/M40 family metallo-hydrolase [Pirellulales bacterium]
MHCLTKTPGSTFIATVGIFEIEPGGSNVVPGRCRLMVDIRSTDPALIERFTRTLDQASASAADAARVSRVAFLELSNSAPVQCDPTLRDALRHGANELGLTTADLASGAGHDAAFMARVCRSAMVFVACKDGKSHAPEEWADRDAIAGGGAAMLQALRLLDRTLEPESEEGASIKP